MNEKSKIHFQELSLDEKISKLSQLANSKGSLTVWQKNSKERYSASVCSFYRDGLELQIRLGFGKGALSENILYSFEVNGLAFFGTALLGSEMFKDGEYFYNLDCDSKLFKSERRINFRILTYPHHKVFLYIPHDETVDDESNIINLKTRMNQTALFKNFLHLVGGQDYDEIKSGKASYRVLDLSVSGVSIRVGQNDASFLQNSSIIEDLILEFNGEKVEIPKAQVVHNMELVSGQKRERQRKVGLKFLDVSIKLDHLLGSLINDTLRDFEGEFENFIKK